MISLAQRKEAREVERLASKITIALDRLIAASGRTFTDAQLEVLYGLCALRTRADGIADVQGAWDLFHEACIG